jgi:ubiquitin-protein ligase
VNMDLARIRREIEDAQRTFSFVESHQAADGKPIILCALQTSQSRIYTLSVSFPEAYPYTMPAITVRKPGMGSSVPHRYTNGNICYMHPKMWNPGSHSLTFAIGRMAKWLSKYEVWLATGKWPGAELLH